LISLPDAIVTKHMPLLIVGAVVRLIGWLVGNAI
jgi:hypothetical protein